MASLQGGVGPVQHGVIKGGVVTVQHDPLTGLCRDYFA